MLVSISPKSFLGSYNIPDLDNMRTRMTLATLRTLTTREINLQDKNQTIQHIINMNFT